MIFSRNFSFVSPAVTRRIHGQCRHCNLLDKRACSTCRAQNTPPRRLPTARVLVTGGSSASVILTSAELYNPATGSWSTTGNMTTARREHIATRLADGTVLIAGGLGSAGEALSSAEVYHPATGNFTPVGNMTVARSTSEVAAALPDGRALVTGGALPRQDNLVDIYNPATETWSATSSLPQPLLGVALTTLQNGQVLAAGGSDVALGTLSRKPISMIRLPASGQRPVISSKGARAPLRSWPMAGCWPLVVHWCRVPVRFTIPQPVNGRLRNI